MRLPRQWAVVVLAAALSAACSGDRPAEVRGIQIGRARNSDKTIAHQTFDFKPSDTMYAAVLLEGRASEVTVHAKWILPGGMTSEADQVLALRDTAVAAFELRSAGGFPPGRYKLEVSMNGQAVGEQEMRVLP